MIHELWPLALMTKTTSHMRPLRHATLWRAVGWLMLLSIAIAMALPTPAVDIELENADKWVHVFAFGILGGWTAQLYPFSRALLWRALGLLAFAAGTELMQVLIPWRSGDVADLAADAVGIALGISLALTPVGLTLQASERRWFGQPST